MNKIDLLGMGLKNLWRRKLRTILTIISVMIGATSIVVMLSLGLGIQEQNKAMMENIGDMTSITVMPRFNYGQPGGNNDSSVLDDKVIEKIEKVDHVERVIPVLNLEATIRAKKYVYTGGLVGLRPEDQESLGLKVSEGRLLEPGEKDHILIGEASLRWGFAKMTARGPDFSNRNEGERIFDPFTTKITLDFDDPYDTGFDPFEETAKKKSKSYKLQTAGILEEGGRYGFSVVFPMDQAKKLQEEANKFRASLYGDQQSGGGNRKQKISYSELQVKVDALENMESVRETLVNDLELEAYGDGEWIQEMESMTKTVQAVLGGIGSIALIVAAIGIANTMIMSTYERTREIGVMKVIGASISDIRNLFLVESAMIGLLGGFFGILQSLGISHLMNKYLASGIGEEGVAISVIPVWLILLALLFSALIGLISGYFPAIRATKLSAIEAIRTE